MRFQAGSVGYVALATILAGCSAGDTGDSGPVTATCAPGSGFGTHWVDASDQIQIIEAKGTCSWKAIDFSVADMGAQSHYRYALNGPATASSPESAGVKPMATDSRDIVSNGDYVEICGTSGAWIGINFVFRVQGVFEESQMNSGARVAAC